MCECMNTYCHLVLGSLCSILPEAFALTFLQLNALKLGLRTQGLPGIIFLSERLMVNTCTSYAEFYLYNF